MADIVVTVPIKFEYAGAPGLRGLDAWCAEGDIAGEEDSDKLWCFTTGGAKPNVKPGDRVYIVCEDRLRGYAPLVELLYCFNVVGFVRGGNAVAVTIPEKITGFRGWRFRWWFRSDEVPFPDWQTTDRRNTVKPRPGCAGQGMLF